MNAYSYQPKHDYPLTRYPGQWTVQRKMRLLFYAWDGRPAEYIAKKLGFTPNQIRAKRREMFSGTTQPKETNITLLNYPKDGFTEIKPVSTTVPVKAIVKNLRTGINIRITISEEKVGELKISAGNHCTLGFSESDDHVFLKIKPDGGGKFKYRKSGNIGHNKSLAIIFSRLSGIPVAAHNGAVDYKICTEGTLMVALPKGENHLVAWRGTAKQKPSATPRTTGPIPQTAGKPNPPIVTRTADGVAPVTRKANQMPNWLPEHDKKILRMKKNGHTDAEVAAALVGVDAGEVKNRRVALSMTARK